MMHVAFPRAGDVPPPDCLASSLHHDVKTPLLEAADALKCVRECVSKHIITEGGNTSSSDRALDEEESCTRAVAFALEKIDFAREATFPYLQTPTSDLYYNNAYALTSLYWAECCVADAMLKAQQQNSDLVVCKAVTGQASQALRAVDLAILRGGHEWAPVAKNVSLVAADLMHRFRNSSTTAHQAKRRRVEDDPISKQLGPDSALYEHYEEKCRQYQEGVATRVIRDVPRVDAAQLSPQEFKDSFLSQGKPVVIHGGMHEWPALMGERAWSNIAYLKERAGDRLIPIEVCSKRHRSQTYLTDSWEREVMPLREYIDAFVAAETPPHHSADNAKSAGSAKSADSTHDSAADRQGYLAQYGLFEQIPELQHDLRIPEYCQMVLPSDGDTTACNLESDVISPSVPADLKKDLEQNVDALGTSSGVQGNDKDEYRAQPNPQSNPPSQAAGTESVSVTNRLTAENIQISAWFGPCDTVSPLHHDPYHNLLAQVVGYKYVRLYPKEESNKVYPRAGALCNNSFVDLDNVDKEKYPLFADIESGYHCVLGPGDMLHIPRHMWHYVRSLSISFSVSFWWGASLPMVYA